MIIVIQNLKKLTKFVLDNKNKFVLIDEDEVNSYQNDTETVLDNSTVPGAFVPLGDEKLVKQGMAKLDLISDLLNNEGKGLDTDTMLYAIVDIQKEVNSMFERQQSSPSVLENDSQTNFSPICYIDIQNLTLTEEGKEKLQESLCDDNNIFFIDYRENDDGNSAISVLMNKNKYCKNHNIKEEMQDYPLLDQC